jgi:prepilin-type processing-associated H-X9-DG protein
MWDHWTANTDVSTASSYNHLPGGANVLYMDGHVEFVKQGKYPVPDSSGVGPGNAEPITTTQQAAYRMGVVQAGLGGNYTP